MSADADNVTFKVRRPGSGGNGVCACLLGGCNFRCAALSSVEPIAIMLVLGHRRLEVNNDYEPDGFDVFPAGRHCTVYNIVRHR